MTKAPSIRHAIITGGSSGIGKAMAAQLAREGAHVSILARSAAQLEKARAEIQAASGQPSGSVTALVADVTDEPQITAAISRAIGLNGAPDLLVTSAGIAAAGLFTEMPDDAFRDTMAVNYFGTLYAIRAALPAMRARRSGSIVMISSGAGLVGIYGYTAYSPTKFALRGLAESLRSELMTMGIHLAIAYPPDTDTPQLAAENETKPPATRLITQTARTWIADDVARTILTGVRRRVFEITPGATLRLLARYHSLVNPILRWHFHRLVVRANRTPDRP